MKYDLKMLPTVNPMTRGQFCRKTPPYSIALDGFVRGVPWFDPSGPRQNFNHHEDVSRLDTRATCAQVLMAIRQGLFETFRDEHGHKVIAYANDCDQDVCTSSFLLRYGHMAEHVMNPALNRLVDVEDKLDTTAGAYPFPPDLPILGELAWVYEPYTRFRFSGGVDRKNAGEFSQVVTDVEARIMQHIIGRGGSIEPDLRYEEIGGGTGWTMVREIGPQARTKMFADGILAFVSVRQRPDGKSWTYTVGRMSQYIIRFNLHDIFKALNSAEARKLVGLSISKKGRGVWGGGGTDGTVGGSPRVHGSILTPKEVEKIVNDVIG